MAKQKKSDQTPEPIPVQIIRVSLGFTTKFKEDLGWWFKNDNKKQQRSSI